MRPRHIKVNIEDYDVVWVENGLFAVTKDGIVIRKKNGGHIICPVQFISKGHNRASVSCSVSGKQRWFYVHRLVAEAYIPNPDSYPQINHKDGNPRNNICTNLEWCTGKQNMQHAIRTGLKTYHHNPRCSCGRGLVYSGLRLCNRCMENLVSIEHRRIKMRNEWGHKDLASIPEPNRLMIIMHYSGKSMAEIGRCYGLSRERIRQIIYNVEGGAYANVGKRDCQA